MSSAKIGIKEVAKRLVASREADLFRGLKYGKATDKDMRAKAARNAVEDRALLKRLIGFDPI